MSSKDKDDVKTTLVMLIGLIADADAVSPEGECLWLNYSTMSMFIITQHTRSLQRGYRDDEMDDEWDESLREIKRSNTRGASRRKR